MAVLQSQLRLSLLDQASGPAKRLMGTLRSLRAAADRQMGFFRGMTGQFAMLTGGAASIYGVAQGFKTAVQSAADFQTAMNRVNALSSATGAEMSKMRKQALELGRTTMFTASQAGDAQGFLAMAGFKANDIMAAMPGTLQLATAAQMDLARTADVVTNILTGYNMEVAELGRVNDVLVKAFTSANVDLTMLAESMKYAGPIASSAGVQFEEATAALSLMGNAGIQGSMAGTSLRGAMTRVLSPTKAIRTAMKQAGVAFTDANGRLLPLAEIVEQLEPHAEDTGLMMELFGQRAGPAMAALVTQGSRKLRELDRELRNSGGTAARVASVQMQGFNGRMLEMRSAAEGFMIAWGDRIIPRITPIVEKFTGVFGQLTGFMESLEHRVTVLDRLTASFKTFAAGLGFADAGDMLTSWREFFVEGLFGNTATFHKDVEEMGATAWKMRQAGENIRAFIDEMSTSNLRQAVASLWDVFKDMPAAGKIATVWATAKTLGLLSGAVTALAMSPMLRVGLALFGFAAAIDAFKNAADFREFVESLKELSGLEMAGLAVGLGLVAGKIWRIYRGLRGIRTVGGVKGALTTGGGAAAGGNLLALLGKLSPWAAALFASGSTAGNSYTSADAATRQQMRDDAHTDTLTYNGGYGRSGPRNPRRGFFNGEQERERSLDDFLSGPDIAPRFQSLEEAIHNPAGTQRVEVTNPMRPNVSVNVTVNATSSDPAGVGREVGAKVRDAVSANFGDGGGGW